MSKPSGEKVAGTGAPAQRVGVPSETGNGKRSVPAADPAAAQIRAEIDDHLATSAEQLQSQGLAPDQARQMSQKKFGDPTVITRRCYWIKQGDTLMFRTAVIALFTILCVALGLTTVNSVRTQRQMAEQMAALAEQLKSLADQQRTAASTPASPAQPKPLEIMGKVFLGSPDKPSHETEVMICRVSDGEVVRRVTTIGDGTYRSGPLAAGDYTLIAKGEPHGKYEGPIGIQTAPLYLFPGEPANVAIDAAYHSGQIRIKLSRPLPERRVEGKYVIASRLYLTASPSSSVIRSTRWTAAYPTSKQWPILIRHCESPPQPPNPPENYRGPYDHRTFAVLTSDDIQNSPVVDFTSGLNPLPAGPCTLLAVVLTDVAPDAPFDPREIIARGRSRTGSLSEADRKWMSDYWVLSEGMGGIWHTALLDAAASRMPKAPRRGPEISGLLTSNGPPNAYSGDPLALNLDILDGKRVILEVEVPPDLQSRIETLVETVTDPAQFERTVTQDKLFVRKVKTTVVGAEPLIETKVPADPAGPSS